MIETLNALLRVRLDEGDDPDAAAHAVLAEMTVADLRTLLLPVVRDEARRIARARVRLAEKQVREMPTNTSFDARALLIEETFVLPSGVRVAWLDATAEQHMERAAWQRRLAGECAENAKMHERAAHDIRAAGARCLRDVVNATVAA